MANETKKPLDNDITYQVTYKYAAPNGQLRTGAIIIKAPDVAAATKMANESLTLQGFVYKITGTKHF